MDVLKFINQVIKIRNELICRTNSERLSYIKIYIDDLLNRINPKKNPLLNIGYHFLSSIDINDQKFLAIGPQKPDYPLNLNKIVTHSLELINKQNYTQATKYLNLIKDEYIKLNPEKYHWHTLSWQKFNLIKLLDQKNNLANLIKNHQKICQKKQFSTVHFKYQKTLWKKRTLSKATYITINPLIGFLESDLFDIWWQNFSNSRPDNNIWFYEEFLKLFKATYAPASFSNNLSGIFINPHTLITKAWQKWFNTDTKPPYSQWAKHYSLRKLASYNFAQDKVNFSLVFDLPNIDMEVLDFIAYHELLHRHIGVKIKTKNNLAHSQMFRKLEAAYPGHKQLNKRLTEFLETGDI